MPTPNLRLLLLLVLVMGSTSHAIFLCSWDLEIDDSLVGNGQLTR